MSANSLIRDSAVLLLLGVAAAFLVKGSAWAFPFLLAGLVGIANLFLITVLVRKLIRPPEEQEANGGARMSLAMAIKFAGTAGAIFFLLKTFEVAPVVMGFSVVMAAIVLRGVLGLFLPTPAPDSEL